MHHALSLGAGVNSTALLLLLVDRKMPLDEVVFADTGAEKPETYTYIQDWIRPYLRQKEIPYTRVHAKDTLIERCMRGHTIPDRRYRWSTRDYKIRPIDKHLKPLAPVTVYLGIAADEATRVKPATETWQTRKWPLIDLGIDRARCKAIIAQKGWPEPPKSGCWFCPFASIGDWKALYTLHPDLFLRAIEIEKNGSKYPEFVLRDGGLIQLGQRFAREERADREQSNLDQYQDECEGFCFT